MVYINEDVLTRIYKLVFCWSSYTVYCVKMLLNHAL